MSPDLVDNLAFLSMYQSQTIKQTNQKKICFVGWHVGLTMVKTFSVSLLMPSYTTVQTFFTWNANVITYYGEDIFSEHANAIIYYGADIFYREWEWHHILVHTFHKECKCHHMLWWRHFQWDVNAIIYNGADIFSPVWKLFNHYIVYNVHIFTESQKYWMH